MGLDGSGDEHSVVVFESGDGGRARVGSSILPSNTAILLSRAAKRSSCNRRPSFSSLWAEVRLSVRAAAFASNVSFSIAAGSIVASGLATLASITLSSSSSFPVAWLAEIRI